MSEKRAVRVEKFIEAPPAHVYRAFTSSPGVLEWMADDAAADARPGGRFYGWWNAGFYAAGTFQEVEADRKVVFTWQSPAEPAPTLVTVDLDVAEGGTQLILTHSGLGEGEDWDRAEENFLREWTSSLANLKSVLETGIDKRVYERPMLGFYIGGLVDEDLKTQLGIPIDYGMHVSGVVEGLGAQRSGLQADDIIADVEGVEVQSFDSLRPVISAHKRGDVVRATVYRGAEKIDMDIELSGMPVPEYPQAPADYAAAGWKMSKKMLKELKGLLKGVSEKQASRRPGPGEWSVKQVLAHLLVSERWTQDFWDLAPRGYKNPDYPGSERTYDAIAETYTAKQIYKELKRTIRVGLRLVETLPEEFAENKAAYFSRAGGSLDFNKMHFNQHLDQIKKALDKGASK